MSWAFDADVLIYSATPYHPLRLAIQQLLSSLRREEALGSVILIPELLTKPTRLRVEGEVNNLRYALAQIRLIELSREIASDAVQIGGDYRLKLADAVHLATAIHAGADRFLTNNSRDFNPATIREIEIVFPSQLTGP